MVQTLTFQGLVETLMWISLLPPVFVAVSQKVGQRKKNLSNIHDLCFVGLPGDDGDVQDEESKVGGGGIQPGTHPRSFVLFRPRAEDVRPADRGDLQSDHFQGNKTLRLKNNH